MQRQQSCPHPGSPVRLCARRVDSRCTLYVHFLMSDLRIEWDPLKARANARKHGITFQEAETAFYDDNALVIPDPDHSSSKSDSC